MKDTTKQKVGVATGFSSGIGKRKLTVFAASVCYYLFMSLVPSVMVICCILPYTPLNEARIIYYINTYIAAPWSSALVMLTAQVLRSNATTLTVSIMLTLFPATGAMRALMKGMDSAYDCERKSGMVNFILQSVMYLVILLITFGIALGFMVYGGRLQVLLSTYITHPEVLNVLEVLLSGIRYLVVMGILMVIFVLLYTYMPYENHRIRDQFPGAIVAAAFWVLFSYFYTIYLSISDRYGAFGLIGTIMVLMIWMYYCLFVLLLGGYINSYILEWRKKK